MKMPPYGYNEDTHKNQHISNVANKNTKVTAYGKWVKLVKPPHECHLPTNVSDNIIEGSVWQCDECKTRWLYKGIMPYSKHGTEPRFEKEGEYTSTYQDDAYCVNCKDKVFMENRIVKISDSGRRMAQGTCGKCGTKVNRILGKAQ